MARPNRCSSSGRRCRPTSWPRARRRARVDARPTAARRPYPGQVIPGFSGHDRQRRRHVLGDAGQRLRRQGATPPTSCCACTTSRPGGRAPSGGAGQIERRRVHLPARPDAPDPVPDRQRGHAGTAAHRRRLRHRVGRPRSTTARSGSARSSARSSSTSTRPARCSRRRCRSRTASRRPTRRSQPGETPRVRAQPRVRGDGVVGRRALPLPDRRGLVRRRPDPAPPLRLRVRHPRRALHRPHAGSTRPTPTPT